MFRLALFRPVRIIGRMRSGFHGWRISSGAIALLLQLIAIPLTAGDTADSAAPSTAITKEVALLFDDGPHPETSPRLLQILESEGVTVSLAQIGERVQAHPQLTRAAAEAGHLIVNHSMRHGRIAEMDTAELREEVLAPLPVFESATGQAPGIYWPPFIASDQRLKQIVEQGGMRLLLPEGFHLNSTRDWDREISRRDILTNALKGLDDPSLKEMGDRRLILFHEWREDSLHVLPEIIRTLKERGYRFITVDELPHPAQ